MNIFVLNCGSSSLKFQLIDTDATKIAAGTERLLASGQVERIGSQGLVTFKCAKESSSGKAESRKFATPVKNHADAIALILDQLEKMPGAGTSIASREDIHAVGHRVVHGGEKLTESVLIDDAVLAAIQDCLDLAPLHNPANIEGIRAIRAIFGKDMKQAAVFDTSFHARMEESAYLYAIPYHLYRRYKLRRYGFHGTSHRYILEQYARLQGKDPADCRVITLHLGNGCSASAVAGGHSISTSMGLTPLEGLIMGTRSGDIDPAILGYLMHKEGSSVDQVEDLLNRQSGLLGISGITGDMRDLLAEASESDDRRAKLAIAMFVRSVRHYVGAYLAELGGAEAILFAGGIGENAPEIRAAVCESFAWCGLTIDPAQNERLVGGEEGEFSSPSSGLKAFVIPTNEELLIARDAWRLAVHHS